MFLLHYLPGERRSKRMKNTRFVRLAQAAAPPRDTPAHRAYGKVVISWRRMISHYFNNKLIFNKIKKMIRSTQHFDVYS